MSEGPWVRFFPSDWLAGTRGLTAVETGVYITLVAMMYERCEPIQHDDERLARLCGTTLAAFKKAMSGLVGEGKIVIVDGGLWNNRVEQERKIRLEKSEAASQSAQVRWEKHQRKQQSVDANAMRKPCETDANQNQNQIRTSSNEDVARTPRDELAMVLDAERAAAVIEHRQRKRAPLTAHAARLLAKQFARWPDPNEAADEMIEAGWNGFKPEWMEGRTVARGQGPPGGNGKLTTWQRQRRAFEELDDERPDPTGTECVVLSLPKPGAN